jgi:uncharacterized protein YllA (UPF0747 family)
MEVTLTTKTIEKINQLQKQKQEIDKSISNIVTVILDQNEIDYTNKNIRFSQDGKSILIEDVEIKE